MSDVPVPRPAIVTIPNVELLKTGTWPCSTGTFTFTTDHLRDAVAAQDDPAIRTPILKLGHTDPRFDGEPTIGRVTNLRTSENGQTLIGDLEGVPAWLADIIPTAFPSRSIEGSFDWTSGNSGVHSFVLTSLALLGVTLPAIQTLDDIAALYGVAASQADGGTHVVITFEESHMPAPVSASVSTEDIRRSYYDGPGSGWAWWICEIQIDPAQLIVENEDDGELYRVPYTINGDNVEFADAVKVEVQYIDAVAASAPAKPPVVFASRAESRPDKPSRDPAAVNPAPPVKGASQVDLTKLRTRLGLPEDASEEDIEAKLTELEDAATKPPVVEPPAPPASLPEGIVAIDESTLEELKVAASRGQAAHDTLRQQARDAFLAGAVQAGKFSPARREHFSKLYDADEEGTRTLIASLAANTVPVTELGNGGTSDVTSDDELYRSVYPERFAKESANG